MSEQLKNYYAAVDLGSNSFHMIVAEMIDNQMHVIDSHKDMVRLADGFDAKGNLSEEKMKFAIQSLRKIGQRIKHIPKSHVRIVGTNTLRLAKNAKVFMKRAQKALGKSIEVISGREEARILYLGVAHSIQNDEHNRLVIDIGGGSTELIIGNDFTPILRESLHMGCVSYTNKFFSDGLITPENWNKAVLHAHRQVVPIALEYKQLGWDLAVGASGTLRATVSVLTENGLTNEGIDPQSLNQLIEKCLQLGSIKKLSRIKGLSLQRMPVFIGGLAIIKGLFDALDIKRMIGCNGALREGLIYDLSGRLNHNDIRKRTIEKLCKQFEVNIFQSELVRASLNKMLDILNLKLSDKQKRLLRWATKLHELGLKISHSHFEEHAAYILNHADMPGFAQHEQDKLAAIIASQRRKIKTEWLQRLSREQKEKVIPLIVLFRLAVLLNRSRVEIEFGLERIEIDNKNVSVYFNQSWLEEHPLTQEDMYAEINYMKALNINYKLFS